MSRCGGLGRRGDTRVQGLGEGACAAVLAVVVQVTNSIGGRIAGGSGAGAVEVLRARDHGALEWRVVGGLVGEDVVIDV